MSTSQTTPATYATSAPPSSSSSPNTRALAIALAVLGGIGVCFVLVCLVIRHQRSATRRRLSLFKSQHLMRQPSDISFYSPRNPDTTTSVVSRPSRRERPVSGQSDAAAGIGDFFDDYQQRDNLHIHPSISPSLFSNSGLQHDIEDQPTPSVMSPQSFPSPRSPNKMKGPRPPREMNSKERFAFAARLEQMRDGTNLSNPRDSWTAILAEEPLPTYIESPASSFPPNPALVC